MTPDNKLMPDVIYAVKSAHGMLMASETPNGWNSLVEMQEVKYIRADLATPQVTDEVIDDMCRAYYGSGGIKTFDTQDAPFKEEMRGGMRDVMKVLQAALRPEKPVDDAEVREAITTLHDYDMTIIEGIGEGCWNAITTLIRAATSPKHPDIAEKLAGWQPIETAPRDETRFLAWDGRAGMFICFWKEHFWNCEPYGMASLANGGMVKQDYTVNKPTHWQPLPAPSAEYDKQRGGVHKRRT